MSFNTCKRNIIYVFLISFNCVCVKVSLASSVCGEEAVKEILSAKMQHFSSIAGEHFTNFSKEFENSFHDEINGSIFMVDPVSHETNKSEKLNSFLVDIFPKFPHFTNLFLNSSSAINYTTNWSHLKQKFNSIINVMKGSQEKVNYISNNYSISSMNLILNFNESLTQFVSKLDSLKGNIKMLNTKMENVKCVNGKNKTAPIAGQGEPEAQESLPRDCFDSYVLGNRESGLTLIQPNASLAPQTVWCNQSWEGGGWTVLMRRCPQKVQLDFRRPLVDYERGFGNPEGEHWIGLQAMHQVTKRTPNELIAFMSIPGDQAFARYHSFRVGQGKGYKLHINGYNRSSTAGNSLSYHNKMLFSTFNNDRDRDPVRSCSSHAGGGGFWFNICYHANPTGIYPPAGLPPDTALHSLLEWRRWKGFYTFLSHFTMMVRPRNRKRALKGGPSRQGQGKPSRGGRGGTKKVAK